MSLRSQQSAASNAIPATAADSLDSLTYQFALRVGLLTYLAHTSAAAAAAAAASSHASDVRNADAKVGNRSSDSWANAFASIGDIFKADAKAKEVRLPKDFVKAFGLRIEAVARGSDAAYTDALFRSTVGAFYGPYHAAGFQRQLKENRKVEELIITFVTTASGVLKKRSSGDEWKAHLMGQVALFVRLVSDTLRPLRHVPAELTDRLAVYLDRLGPALAPQQAPAAPPSADGTASAAAPPALAVAAHAFELVRQVAVVFGVPEDQLKRDIQAIRRFCTEKAALRDLKVCMSLVHQGARFPGRREDFDSDDAYARWRRTELDTLQQLILALASQNRDLVRSDAAGAPPLSSAATSASSSGTGAPTSSSSFRMSLASTSSATSDYFPSDDRGPNAVSRPLSVALADDVVADGARTPDLVSVPPEPRDCYGRLLELCLAHDLERVKELAADEEVSLRILSQPSQDLLAECALRWRVMLPLRAVRFLETIGGRYANDEIPIIQCVTEAIADVDRIEAEWPYDDWPVQERVDLHRVLSDLFDTFLRRLYEAVAAPEASALDDVVLLREAAELVHANRVFREDVRDLDERFDELARAVRAVAVHQYEQLRLRAAAARAAEAHVGELLRLCDWLRDAAAALDKRFRAPLFDRVDVVALFVGEVGPLLAADLFAARGAIEALLVDDPAVAVETAAQREADVRQLYAAAREAMRVHDAFCPAHPLHRDFSAFEPWVRKWLRATDAKTLEWVQSAVGVDSFAPEGRDRHSSSIVDLFDSCKSAVAFLVDLQWPERRAHALFVTRLAQTISKAVEEYCSRIEQLFNAEMFPRAADDPEVDERTSAWLIKAKGLYAGDKKAQPFVFRPESLVKLNNIQAARDLLDQLYTAVDADAVADALREAPDPSAADGRAPAASPERFLFTLKVVLGERLVAKNGTAKLDPFLTLSDEKGRRVAKTRTLYDTPDPRWSETFDVSVQGALWLAATVYDRNLVDEHDLLGRAYFKLDPRAYGDFLAHDLWLKLDTHGRLLLRISMEGEKDDIQFYFGRAFRSLKRTEADMVRVVVDKMSPFIRQFISRATIKGLVKKGFNFDLNLRLEKMRIKDVKLDRLRHIFTANGAPVSEIPPVPGLPPDGRYAAPRLESPSLAAGDDGAGISPAKRKSAELTDGQIEDAIGLLFEYFEETFAVLKSTLSDAAFAAVMSKIWKEILTTVESLLVPPLSDAPVDMRPLSDKEVYIAIRWLKGLLSFFHAEGQGIPLDELQSARYHALVALPLYYDMGTDELEMECARVVGQLLAAATGAGGPGAMTVRRIARSKSVLSQRNLGTIRQRQRDKRSDKGKDYRGAAEMMLRILRMRPRTHEFLAQQLVTLKRIDQESARPPPLQRRNMSDVRQPASTPQRLGVAAAAAGTGASSRAHSPVQLVDRPLSSLSLSADR